MSPAEVCELQNEIIKTQSEIIDDLFRQVIQYATIDEEEQELEKMQRVLEMRKEVPSCE